MGMCARDRKVEKAGEGLVALKMYINPQHCQMWLCFCWSTVYTVSYIVIVPLTAQF